MHSSLVTAASTRQGVDAEIQMFDVPGPYTPSMGTKEIKRGLIRQGYSLDPKADVLFETSDGQEEWTQLPSQQVKAQVAFLPIINELRDQKTLGKVTAHLAGYGYQSLPLGVLLQCLLYIPREQFVLLRYQSIVAIPRNPIRDEHGSKCTLSIGLWAGSIRLIPHQPLVSRFRAAYAMLKPAQIML
jgi:hypothetical protein